MVGYPHEVKGQGIYCYVTLKSGVQPSDELKKELVAQVRKEIGPTASPDLIQFSPGLPKTRSGKIMRRILRKIAEDDFSKSRRHLDPRRSGRGRRPRQQPAEQEESWVIRSDRCPRRKKGARRGRTHSADVDKRALSSKSALNPWRLTRIRTSP